MAKKKKAITPSEEFDPNPGAEVDFDPNPGVGVAQFGVSPVAPEGHGPYSGKTIDVYSPKEGKAYRIPVENVALAKELGMILDTPELKGLRKFKKDSAGLSGAAEAFADRFVSWGSAGVSDVVDEHLLTDYQKAKKEIVLKDHEFASTTGAVLGFLASDLWMGPLISGGAKALGIGGKAAVGAARSAELAEKAGLILKPAEELSAKAAFEGAIEEAAHVPQPHIPTKPGGFVGADAWAGAAKPMPEALHIPTAPGGFGLSPLAAESAAEFERLPSYLRSSALERGFRGVLEDARAPLHPPTTVPDPFIPGQPAGGPHMYTPEGTLVSPQFGVSPGATTLTEPGSIKAMGRLLAEQGTLVSGPQPQLDGLRMLERRLAARRGVTIADDFVGAKLQGPPAPHPTIPELPTIRDIGVSPAAESLPATTAIPGSATVTGPKTAVVPSAASAAHAWPSAVTERGGLASRLGEFPTAVPPTSVWPATRALPEMPADIIRPVADGGFFGLPPKMGPHAPPTWAPALDAGASTQTNSVVASGAHGTALDTLSGRTFSGMPPPVLNAVTPAGELLNNPLSKLPALPRTLPGIGQEAAAQAINSAEAAAHLKAITGGDKVLEQEILKLAADTLASKVAAGAPDIAAKAIEKSAPKLMEQMVKSGLRIGMEGAAFTAPAALTEAYFGDPKKSGEMLVQSLVLGGMLGSAFGASKVFAGRVGQAVSGGLTNTSPRVRGFVLDNVWRSLGEVSSLNQAAKGIGKKAGGARGVAQELVDRKLIRRPFESFEEYQGRLHGFLDDIMAQKGERLARLDLAGARPNQSAFLSVFSEGIDKLRKKFAHEDLVPALEKLQAEYMDKASQSGWSLETANRFRVDLEDRLRKSYKSGNFSELQAEVRDIARNLNDKLMEEADREAKRLKMEPVGAQLRADALSFHRVKVAEEAVQHAVKREKNLNQFGLRDHMAGLAGAAMGGGVGGAVAAIGMKMARHELNPLIGHAMYWLDSRGGNGLVAIEQAYKAVGEKLEKVAPMLSGKVIPEFKAAASIAPAALLGKYIGDKNLPKDKHKLYEMFVDKLDELAANPNDVAEAIAEPIMQHAPESGKALGAQVANNLMYLAGEIPRGNHRNPFASRYRPTDVELQNFYSKVEVFNDWTSVLGHTAKRTLRPAHIDAMSVMYPEILHDIRKHAMDWMIEPTNQPLPYHTGLMLSILMERRLEPSLDMVSSLQAMYNTAQQNSQRPAKIQSHRSRMPNLEVPVEYSTEVTRISAK